MRKITAIRIVRTMAIAAIFFLFFGSRFIDLFIATEEGRGYLEMVLQEPLRAFLIAAIEISRDPSLMAMFLQFGIYCLFGGFIIDYLLNWVIEKTDSTVRSQRGTQMRKLSLLTLFGLILFIVTLIPVTAVEEAINTQFIVAPGAKHEEYYHTHIFGKSILKGEVTVEGESIQLTINGYTPEPVRDPHIRERYSFAIDPADDLYNFIFNNTEGHNESSVKFRLGEIWTRPIGIGSHPGFIAGLIGFFLFLAGLIALAISRLRAQ